MIVASCPGSTARAVSRNCFATPHSPISRPCPRSATSGSDRTDGRCPSAAAGSITTIACSAGSSCRTSCSFSSWWRVETTTMVAAESARMYLTWPAESVGYTGTVTAPAVSTARSTLSHSGRLSAISATRSPGFMPSADNPRDKSRTPSRNSLPVLLRTVPPRAVPTTAAPWNRPMTWNGRSASVRTSESMQRC